MELEVEFIILEYRVSKIASQFLEYLVLCNSHFKII